MSSNLIDQILEADGVDLAAALLEAAEDQWFDRKSVRLNPKDLAPALVAFANAEGGVIVIGLSNGVVEGFAGYETKLNDFRQAPIDFTNPPVRAHFREVPCVNAAGDADRLLVVTATFV